MMRRQIVILCYLMLTLFITPISANVDDPVFNLRFGERTPDDLQWSPNGHFLAVHAGTDIVIYDAQLQQVNAQRGDVDTMFWLPYEEATLAFYLFNDETTLLWDIQTDERSPTNSLPPLFWIRLGVFSPDGTQYTQFSWDPSDSNREILRLWDTLTQDFISEEHLPIPSGERTDSRGALHWDEHGITAIISTQDNYAWLIHPQDEPRILSWEGIDGPTGRFVISEDGAYAVHRVGRTLLRWSLDDDSPPLTTTLPAIIDDYAIQDGRVAAIDREGHIGVWHLDDLTPIWEHQHASEQSGQVHVQWQPQTNHLTIASTDGMIEIWDIARDTIVATTYAHVVTECVYWSADGERIIAVNHDENLQLSVVFDAETGEVIRGAPQDYLTDEPLSYRQYGSRVAWTSDGGRLALVRNDGTVQVFGYGEEQPIYTLSADADVVAWSRDGDYLATWRAGDGLRIWASDDGVLLDEIDDGEGNRIAGFAWSPTSAQVMVASFDVISIYDVSERLHVQSYPFHFLQYRGLEVAVNWREEVAYISFGSEDVILTLPDGTLTTRLFYIASAVLSPDGQYAVGAGTGTPPSGVVDFPTGEYVLELPGLSNTRCQSAWHPTQSRLALNFFSDRKAVWSP